MGPTLTVILFLMSPLFMWLLWRRMKNVQTRAYDMARKPERHAVTPVEDIVGTDGGQILKKSLSFDDDLASAENISGDTVRDDVESRRF